MLESSLGRARRPRLIELVATYSCRLHEADPAANIDRARRAYCAQPVPLCLAKRTADRLLPALCYHPASLEIRGENNAQHIAVHAARLRHT